jgi:hypothetical protein
VVRRYKQPFWTEASWSLSFAFFYFCWTILCAYLNDWNWPYPVSYPCVLIADDNNITLTAFSFNMNYRFSNKSFSTVWYLLSFPCWYFWEEVFEVVCIGSLGKMGNVSMLHLCKIRNKLNKIREIHRCVSICKAICFSLLLIVFQVVYGIGASVSRVNHLSKTYNMLLLFTFTNPRGLYNTGNKCHLVNGPPSDSRLSLYSLKYSRIGKEALGMNLQPSHWVYG